jgi:hypothetical protein
MRRLVVLLSLACSGCACFDAVPQAQIVEAKPIVVRAKPGPQIVRASVLSPVRVPPEPPTIATPASLTPLSASPANATLSDDAVRAEIVVNAKKGYGGNCPCPDDLAVDSSICGDRSAYSRRGNTGFICFPHDVLPHDIALFRATVTPKKKP